jgi:hypothetical protein
VRRDASKNFKATKAFRKRASITYFAKKLQQAERDYVRSESDEDLDRAIEGEEKRR